MILRPNNIFRRCHNFRYSPVQNHRFARPLPTVKLARTMTIQPPPPPVVGSTEVDVDKHYGLEGGLLEKIERGLALANANNDDNTLLHVDQLAPIDAFHSRGIQGTLDLIQLVASTTNKTLTSDQNVLDVGCGFGGTARHLAHHFGCRVTGVDLTQEFVTVGQELTKRVGLDDQVTILQGSALDLPLDETEQKFDVVWTEHVQMNIEDKEQFYSEISRLMKESNNGCFVFHDVFRGINPEQPAYPVPWADHAGLSQLAREEVIRAAMDQAGLEIVEWQDKTEETVAFFEKALEKIAENGPPPLGIHLLMGSTARDKIRNHVFNLKEGRNMVVMGVATKKK